MATRTKPTSDAVEIIHRRYFDGHSLSMLRRIAAALDKRVEIRFLPLNRKPQAA